MSSDRLRKGIVRQLSKYVGFEPLKPRAQHLPITLVEPLRASPSIVREAGRRAALALQPQIALPSRRRSACANR
jgi:hypothetical protein